MLLLVMRGRCHTEGLASAFKMPESSNGVGEGWQRDETVRGLR